jgi:hypothetical protein
VESSIKDLIEHLHSAVTQILPIDIKEIPHKKWETVNYHLGLIPINLQEEVADEAAEEDKILYIETNTSMTIHIKNLI